MRKLTITRTWFAGLIALVVGLVIGGISLGMMLANGGHWEPATTGSGSQFIPTLNVYFWTTLWWTIAGFTVALVGMVLHLVAWIGALLNTNLLADKTWFFIMLGTGLMTFAFAPLGFAGMLAYILAGPDGAALPQVEPLLPPYMRQPAPMPAQPPREPLLTH